ncbi:MAG: UDP-N-acetylmuramoyl-L-alanyl-D-glutamate--2,6-diaminopimelate ligase [Bacteroidia bacterium]
MKLLSDIVYKLRIEHTTGSMNIAIATISFDSRKVKKDSLFVAISGTQVDGNEFIPQAIASGAVAVVCEKLPTELSDKVTYIKVNNASEALGIIACNFYDNPSRKLKLIGVTGTNGKTTTVTLLFNLFKNMGYSVGLISTVQNKINSKVIPATHTTPDPISLNQLLNNMVMEGCKYAFMEVSSHALVQNRVKGIQFEGAVFTNITHDHLDYHKTFDEYIKAKKLLFDSLPKTSFALFNKDDRNGEIMVQNCQASIKSYSLKSISDFKAKILESHISGMLLTLDQKEVWVKLIGEFNAYNVLAVYSTATLLNQDPANVLTTLSNLNSVEGRFQYYKSKNDVTGIIDYAHTPDALQNVLNTIKSLRQGNEKIITVVGCGGDRDKAKRPTMALIAATESNKVILTSDNPRTEDPEVILNEMMKGLSPIEKKKSLRITDRKEAIRTACSIAEKGDIILIAGKGHEKYQEINGVKNDFDDYKIFVESINAIEV